ncbi:ABC transporter permease [Mucilaginibacter ximonensis]|uniref:ABC transporter permease n=1 Tax=Mucilaginibacter ximonensis TaxID=538021 RepID=A0ABW5Y956_9SPHI
MLKNYFKIAIAVLKRRKFFTFISLFGISFTLTILMVLTAFMDNVINPTYPDLKRDRSLYIGRVEIRNTKLGWRNTSSPSFYFLTRYAGSMKTPVNMAISSNTSSSNAYVGDKKIVMEIKYTNAAFWDVADFEFTEGKPYDKAQIEQSQHLAVITEKTKANYFGDERSVVGKYIEADNIKYRVIGVVKNPPITSSTYYASMYLPYTLTKGNYKDTGNMGEFGAVLLAKSTADVPKMQKEYDQIVTKIPTGDKNMDELFSSADTYFKEKVRGLYGNGPSSGFSHFSILFGAAIFLFMLLPTINLVNINITRIMERSSEIGVRKAFGASSKTLVYQFIIENLILTGIGGLLGVLLSTLALYFINQSDFLDGLHLTLNFTILFYGLIACLVFGILSGVYPAWRMSKLAIVKALKAQ